MFLFILGCVPIRIFFIYIAKKASKNQLRLLSIPALLISISFMYQQKKGKKIGFFGGPVWWKRNIHALIWFIFAILAYKKNQSAYIALIVDLMIGIISFTHNYYN
tara:strand:+ start:521 stop:835 length:315 start_codon:yes stop_codon:yes gene_type:complete